MTKLRTTVLMIAVVALVAMPAFAFEGLMAQTPRMDATGGAFTSVSVDETASSNNPAGLPLLQTFGTTVSPWPSRASLNVLVDGPADIDMYSAFYAGRSSDNTTGWGATYSHLENDADTDNLALGYGQRIGEGLTAGLAVAHMSNGDDATSFNLGGIYRREIALNAWRFGLLARDLADEYGGPFVDLGAAVELPVGVDVAATLFDVTDEVDSRLAIGAEWDVPMTEFIVRAGNNDGDFSAGAAYQWSNFELGVAWMDRANDDWFTAGVTGSF
ncbi:MAG: hypothetical protein ACOCX2_03080 [Armatimonadota bacterium]